MHNLSSWEKTMIFVTVLYALSGLLAIGIGTTWNHFHPMLHETYEQLFIQAGF